MRTLQRYRYQQRSLMLLIPLVLTALCTYAFSPTFGEVLFSEGFALYAHNLGDFCFPLCFTLTAALLIPAISRTLQLFTVSLNYTWLFFLAQNYLKLEFICSTACIIAALTSCIVFLPRPVRIGQFYPNEQHPLKILWLGMSAFALPGIVFATLLIISRQLELFIYHLITANFIESALSVVLAPAYLLLQSMGFQVALEIRNLEQTDAANMSAIINAVVLSNLIALPCIMWMRACFVKGWLQALLTFLGLITLITSHVGMCVSMEMAIMLLFFPGSFSALLLTSCALFLLSRNLQLDSLANLSELYQPDLRLNLPHFALLGHDYLMLCLCAALAPVLIVCALTLMQNHHRQRLSRHIRDNASGFRVNSKSLPDLQVIALLRSIGGLSNLKHVNRQGSLLLLKVLNYQRVSSAALGQICLKKVQYDRQHNLFLCHLGANCYTIEQRLTRLLADAQIGEGQEIPLSQPFLIK
ncbi:MAG: hypothetical protein K6F05_06685 [Succinivibrio sp.]|nr:hypothetical protein [Succinivibrio sp.]